MQKLMGLILLTMVSYAHAADPAVAMYSDIQVEIKLADKTIYRATALVPRNIAVKWRGKKVLPIKITCPPSTHANNSATYEDGIDLTLSANPFQGNAITQLTYDIAIPYGSGKMQPYGMCAKADIKHKHYDGQPSFNLKPNETNRVGGGLDIQINTTLKGTYQDAPKGRVIGEFVPDL